jgi:hypothetical protein
MPMPRPPSYTTDQERQIVKLYGAGKNWMEISDLTGIPRTSCQRIVEKHQSAGDRLRPVPSTVALPATEPVTKESVGWNPEEPKDIDEQILLTSRMVEAARENWELDRSKTTADQFQIFNRQVLELKEERRKTANDQLAKANFGNLCSFWDALEAKAMLDAERFCCPACAAKLPPTLFEKKKTLLIDSLAGCFGTAGNTTPSPS